MAAPTVTGHDTPAVFSPFLRAASHNVGTSICSAYQYPVVGGGDHLRARMPAHLIRTRRPDLLLVHFLDLDHDEHAYGQDAPEAMGGQGVQSQRGVAQSWSRGA